ncbi:MAG: hypothetical protein QNJ51_13785 [Calothrix sp. MO_167.B12]|nr:hypothetical protein [Calothrix sp. MO_167.B12]
MLSQTFKIAFICFTIVTTSTITGCNQDIPNSSVKANLKVPSQNLTEFKVETKRGKLIYKKIPPIKSTRAYQGNEFYLVTTPQNPRGLVLHPSEKVDREQLKTFHNQQVEITTVYVAGTRPSGSKNSCPLDVDGRCMVQGEGYRVISIQAVNE